MGVNYWVIARINAVRREEETMQRVNFQRNLGLPRKSVFSDFLVRNIESHRLEKSRKQRRHSIHQQ